MRGQLVHRFRSFVGIICNIGFASKDNQSLIGGSDLMQRDCLLRMANMFAVFEGMGTKFWDCFVLNC